MTQARKELLLALLVVAAMPVALQAQNSCSPKGIDVCQMARQIADDTAATLPMRLNQNVSMQTVFAEANIVTMTAKFEYNRAFLDQSLATAEMTNDQMLDVMREHSRSAMCAAEAPTKQFIGHGGVIRYLYRFNDGSMYTTISVTSCA